METALTIPSGQSTQGTAATKGEGCRLLCARNCTFIGLALLSKLMLVQMYNLGTTHQQTSTALTRRRR